MQYSQKEIDRDAFNQTLKNLTFLRAIGRKTVNQTKAPLERIVTISTMTMKANRLKKNHRRNDIAKQARKRNR